MKNSEDNGARLPLSELKPSMKLQGRVTKTELFGAFVDIGAEREGLVHISMLKPGQVNRVEDVVEEGQEVEVWVHRVDPNAGRLELTMIKPVTLRWKEIGKGMRLKGKIVRIENFGVFVDVGAERPGLVHVSEMSSEYVQDPSELVQVGEEVDVSVIDVDRKKRQIRFSMKDSMLGMIEDEEDLVEETPTAMELALREALGQSDESPQMKQSSDDKNKKKGTRRKDEIEDILSRTLKQRVKTASSNE